MLMLATKEKRLFTIGVCATESSEGLPQLIRLIVTESFPEDYILSRIVIVASACSENSLRDVRKLASEDVRIILIEEKSRRGKANALNTIIGNASGSYLVFVNGDAMPERNSITKLLFAVDRPDEKVGVASGCPTFRPRNGPTSLVEELFWDVHNECSLRLNHLNVSNHSNDEMMVIRTDLLRQLPDGLVNDGAYMAGRAKLLGYSIKFCSDAPVRIDVPSKCIDLIRQRRRIIFGHFQVWRLTGRNPKTIESLLLQSPFLGLSMIVRILARNSKLIRVTPLAIVCEWISIILGLKDAMASTQRHAVWERYGN